MTRRLLRGVVTLCSFLLGAVGCNALLGIDPPVVLTDGGPSNGETGTGGEGGADAGEAGSGALCGLNPPSCNTATKIGQGTKPWALAVQGGFVYWTNYASTETGGSISRAPIDGSGQTMGVTPAVSYPRFLAVDDNRVYFTSENGGVFAEEIDAPGSQVTPLAPSDNPAGIAVKDQIVYWVDRTGVHAIGPEGGPPRTLTQPGPDIFGRSLAFGGDGIYWAEAAVGVFRVGFDFDGGRSSIAISSGENSYFGVAPTSDGVYFGAQAQGNQDGGFGLFHCNGVCPGKTAPLATGRDIAFVIADDENVYFTNPDNGTVHRVGRHSDERATVAVNQKYPHGVAVDGTYLYWGNEETGEIMKVDRCCTSPKPQ